MTAAAIMFSSIDFLNLNPIFCLPNKSSMWLDLTSKSSSCFIENLKELAYSKLFLTSSIDLVPSEAFDLSLILSGFLVWMTCLVALWLITLEF